MNSNGEPMLLTLLVLVPLLTGLACWPLRKRAVLERLNLLAFGIVAVLAAWLGAEVLARGTVEAFGGFLRVDALSALVVCLTASSRSRAASMLLAICARMSARAKSTRACCTVTTCSRRFSSEP